MRTLLAALLAAICWSARAEAQPRTESQTSGTRARLQAISIAGPGVAWASGVNGTYVRTTDGGKTWRAATVPGADSLEFRDVHAWSADRAVLLAAGTGDKSRIYRTVDGGRTWTRVFQNSDPKAFYDCFDFRGDTGVVLSDEVNGAFPLARTTDGGRTWAPYRPAGWDRIAAVSGEGGFAASGTCVAYRPDGALFFGTAKAGRIVAIEPAGAAAIRTPMVTGDAAGIATLAFRSKDVAIAAGGDLNRPEAATDNVIVSRDGGRTWTLGGRPPFGGMMFGLAYVPTRPGTVVGVSPKGSAWSADDGASWRPLDGSALWAVAFGADGVGWGVGPDGRITKLSFR